MKHFSRLLLLMVLSWHGVTQVTEVVNATLSTAADDIEGLHISVNDLGHAMAVWGRNDGGTKSIEAAYFNGTSWSSAVTISGASEGLSPWVSLNNQDKAVAVWQTALTTGSVRSNTFVSGSWQGAEDIKVGAIFEYPNVLGVDHPTSRIRVGLDDTGNAAVAWLEVNSSASPTEFYVYATGSLDTTGDSTGNADNWITPLLLNENLVDERIFMDPQSQIFTVYGEENSVGTALISWMRSNDGSYLARYSTNGASITTALNKYTSFDTGGAANTDGTSNCIDVNESGDFLAVSVIDRHTVSRDFKKRADASLTEVDLVASDDPVYNFWVNISNSATPILHQALSFRQIGSAPIEGAIGDQILVASTPALEVNLFSKDIVSVDRSNSFLRLNPMLCSFNDNNALLMWNRQGINTAACQIGIMQYDGASKSWNTNSIQYIDANLKKLTGFTNDVPFYLSCSRKADKGQHYAGLIWWNDTTKTVQSLFSNGTYASFGPSPATNIRLGSDSLNREIDLIWDPSPDTDITEQRVYRSNGVDGFVDISGPVSITSPSFYTDSTISGDVDYSYLIRVTNSAGLTSDSIIVMETYAPVKLAKAPTSVDAQCVIVDGSLAIDVTWASDNSKLVLKHFNVYRANTTGYELIKEGIDVDDRLYRDTAVEFGSEYTYYVVAVDFNGVESNSSDPATAGPCTTATPPPPPTELNLTCPTSTSVDLSWVAPNSTLIDSQKIYRNGVFLSDALSSDESYSDSTVPTDTELTYEVVSVKDGNESDPARATITCSAATLPAAPSVPHAVCAQDGNKSIHVTWQASTSDVSKYRVYRLGHDDVLAEVEITTDGDNNGYAYNDTQIAYNIPYYYSVSAIDNDGIESNRVTTNTVTCYENAPAMIMDLSVTDCTSGSSGFFTLEWTPPSSNCTKQELYRDGVLITSMGCSSDSSPHKDSFTVALSTEYEYFIRAYNETEYSESNHITTACIDPTPDIIDDLDFACIIENDVPSLRVTWQAPSSPGILSYKIYRNNRLIGTVSSSITTFIDSSIGRDLTYSYNVGVVTAAGERKSRTVGATACSNPVVPENVRGSCTANQFLLVQENYKTITWAIPAVSASNVTSQKIYRDGTLIATLSAGARSYEDHDRPLGIAETYGVATVDQLGLESKPTEVQVTC